MTQAVERVPLTGCDYVECMVPEARHSVCAAREISECYGDLQHQHVPKRSQGGKRCDVLLCAGHHDCIDNGTKYRGQRLTNDVRVIYGKRFWRCWERGKGVALVEIELQDLDGGGEAKGVPVDRESLLHPAVGVSVRSNGLSPSPPESYDLTGALEERGRLNSRKGRTVNGGSTPPASTTDYDLTGYLKPDRLDLPPNLPFDAWLAVAEHLVTLEKGRQWWWGDLFAYGENMNYDEYWQAVSGIAKLLGLDPATIGQWRWMSHRLPPDSLARRICQEVLTPSHGRAVASSRLTLEEATVALWNAAADGLTSKELGERVPKDETLPRVRTERYTVDELRERFDAWPERVTFRNNLNRGFAAFMGTL